MKIVSNLSHIHKGLKQNKHHGTIDKFNAMFNGNQLVSIEKKAAPVLRAGSFDFRKVSSPSEGSGEVEYRYDDNGALVYDANRGITSVEYDLRNNPRLIQFSDGSRTEYVYSALGEKLKTIHRTATPNSVASDGDDTFVGGDPTSNPFPMSRLLASSSVQNTDTATSQDMTAKVELSIDSTEYIGDFIFENGHADKYLFPGGYYSFVSTSPLRSEGSGEVSSFHYYLTDHLGNNRVVVNDNGDIEQTTHYYPFGAVYADADKNPDFQKYKYTSKELDLTHGLNTYDHGARQNYSILGVWDRIDPLAEKYYNISPYAVCHDNPTLLFDPNGMDDIFDQNGNYIKDTGKGDYVYIQDKYQNLHLLSSYDYNSNVDNVKMLKNVSSYYLSKSDSRHFSINVEEASISDPAASALAYNVDNDSYNVELHNGKINTYLDNKYNFENIAFHESRYRYKSETLGGNIGEVEAILMQTEHNSWKNVFESFVYSQAVYARQSLNNALNKVNLSKEQIKGYISKLNDAFIGMADFSYSNGTIECVLSIHEIVVTSKNKQ